MLEKILEEMLSEKGPDEIKASSAEIVVHGTQEKPYYEIEYFDLSDNKYHIGFSSYSLDVVLGYLDGYFEIVNKHMNDENSVGGVDRSEQIDRISIENAVEAPFWMSVWATEPKRMIDVRMSYSDLKTLCDLIDKRRTRGWIPVEERLPGDGDSVLCTDGKYIYLTEYDADLDVSFGDIDGIIAWQPLPGSYISKKETETDWSKVPVDTPVLVRDSDEEPWKRRHFAFYKDGKVFTWLNRSTSFVNGNDKDKSIGWNYAKLAQKGAE